MTKRKFYKATFILEILSEEPLTGDESLQTLSDAITNGDDSGSFEMKKQEELNGEQAAEALMEQGSDPEFFQIDEDGNDIED